MRERDKSLDGIRKELYQYYEFCINGFDGLSDYDFGGGNVEIYETLIKCIDFCKEHIDEFKSFIGEQKTESNKKSIGNPPSEKQLNMIFKIEFSGIAKCKDKSTSYSCWKFINDNIGKYKEYCSMGKELTQWQYEEDHMYDDVYEGY